MGRHPRPAAGNDGHGVFLQQGVLAVEGDSKTDGGGGQQDIQVLGPLVVDLIVDVPQQQHQSTDHGGKEQGVDPLLTGALVDGPGQEKGGQGENQAEPAGLGKESAEPLIHGRGPPFSGG